MPYDLSNRLVIGLASSALFDLSESDGIFREKGQEEYRKYQRHNENEPLPKGIAFPFIEQLLSLNEIDRDNPPVEVILLSRNDPDTGLRVMNTIEHYQLGITRALFLQGKTPYNYIHALSIDLFLSAHANDVKEAVRLGYPAGQVLDSKMDYQLNHHSELRVALDFDGVIVDDESEKIYQKQNIQAFHEHEQNHVGEAHHAGPLFSFLKKLSKIQKDEERYAEGHPQYQPKLRIAMITARNAPSHKRVIHTLRAHDIMVNEAFFLGGIDKCKILEQMNPHIFFDDQETHLNSAKNISPSVHIPFGIANIQQGEK